MTDDFKFNIEKYINMLVINHNFDIFYKYLFGTRAYSDYTHFLMAFMINSQKETHDKSIVNKNIIIKLIYDGLTLADIYKYFTSMHIINDKIHKYNISELVPIEGYPTEAELNITTDKAGKVILNTRLKAILNGLKLSSSTEFNKQNINCYISKAYIADLIKKVHDRYDSFSLGLVLMKIVCLCVHNKFIKSQLAPIKSMIMQLLQPDIDKQMGLCEIPNDLFNKKEFILYDE